MRARLAEIGFAGCALWEVSAWHNRLIFQSDRRKRRPEPGILQDWEMDDAEDQANPPAAATLEPPKATKHHEAQNRQGGTPGGQRPKTRKGCSTNRNTIIGLMPLGLTPKW